MREGINERKETSSAQVGENGSSGVLKIALIASNFRRTGNSSSQVRRFLLGGRGLNHSRSEGSGHPLSDRRVFLSACVSKASGKWARSTGRWIPRPRKMNFTTPAIMVRTMDPCMDMGDGQPMDPEACALKGNTSNTCTCTNMSMGMDMDMDMSMNMYFTFTKDATILFEKWQVDTAGGLAASAVAIFVLAVLYEGLKFFREWLIHRSSSNDDSNEKSIKSITSRILSSTHGCQTFLHMVQMGISYLLMLIFMTYNGWLCVAVLLGGGVGYFLFGWKRTTVVDNNEHCH